MPKLVLDYRGLKYLLKTQISLSVKAGFLTPNQFVWAHLNIRQVENENDFHSNKAKIAKLETLLQKTKQTKLGNRNFTFTWISSCPRHYLQMRKLVCLWCFQPESAQILKSVRGWSLPGDFALYFLNFLVTPKCKRCFMIALWLSLISPLIWRTCVCSRFAFTCLVLRRVLMSSGLLANGTEESRGTWDTALFSPSQKTHWICSYLVKFINHINPLN